MEPARLRALLARTPALPADLLTRPSRSLPARTRAWLQGPDERLIDSDLHWMSAIGGQVVVRPDRDFPVELAQRVQQSCEILREMGINNINQYVTSSARRDLEPAPGPSLLDNKYEMLLDAAGFEPVDIDVLAFRTGWPGHDVAAMLLLLELQGRIAPRPGGRYCRLS